MSSNIVYRNDGLPWYAESQVTAARVDKAIKEGRAIKILRPDIESKDGKWEAIWSGGHVWADTFAEMHEALREGLGIPVDTAAEAGRAS